MDAADPSPQRLWWLPRTRAGRWSVGLFLLAVAAVLFMAAEALTQEAPGTFGRDPLFAATATLAAMFGVTSAGLGGYAIIRHERALVLLLTTAAGVNVLAYVLGEAVRAP